MKDQLGRASAALFLGLLALAGSAPIRVAAQPAAQPDPELQPYVNSGMLADIGGGRRIHLLCMGSGSPTVILSAGAGNWLETWRKVQPAVARKTRVCAWDRAGYGFSTPSVDPQDIRHTTSDLERALKAAKIAGPYVSVGHSLGGLETLLFADRNLKQVAGIVLEDPSFPGQDEAARKHTGLQADSDLRKRQQAALSDACIADLKAHRGEPEAIQGGRCLTFPLTYPEALKTAMRPAWRDAAWMETRKSFNDHLDEDKAIALKADRSYGSIPLIVLTAGNKNTPPGSTASDKELAAWDKDWSDAHDRLAALSTRGQNRRIEGTTHYIHLIKPDVVIAAIEEVVDAARR